MANRLAQAGPRSMTSTSSEAQPEGYHLIDGAATVTPDLADGLNHQITLDRASTTIAAPTYTGGTISGGLRLVLKLKQDATGGRQVSWNATYKGVSGFELYTLASTYSTFSFVYNGSNWELAQHPLIGVTE